jgi:hypothetical protein
MINYVATLHTARVRPAWLLRESSCGSGLGARGRREPSFFSCKGEADLRAEPVVTGQVVVTTI